jgi:sulfite reductase (NADPH) flavoprotein alpha-component
MLSNLLNKLKGGKNIDAEIGKWTKDEAEYILLVGSESGKTNAFAKAFLYGLVKAGKTVFMDDLDNYTTYKKAKYFLVFTATFGDGDAPGNAVNFSDLLKEVKPINSMEYSVVGFGSTVFPNFCQFGVDVNTWLNEHPSFKQLTPLVRINEQSNAEFRSWLSLWNRTMNLNIRAKLPHEKKALKRQEFEVVECTDLNVDDTAVIRLRPKKNVKFQSGDLFNIIPNDSEKPRWYSIARIDDDVVLSVKKHEQGLCSSYLCNSKVGDIITAAIEKNAKFHFPTEAPSAWLISNGTGIAPYLGMITESVSTTTHLTWGGRTEASFDTYKNYIEDAYNEDRIESYELALSRTENKQYVQDVLSQQKEKIADLFEEGCVFMICGSMAMQHAVLKVLDDITLSELDKPLSAFQHSGQLLTDCY